MFCIGLADSTVNERTLKLKLLAALIFFFPYINFLMMLFK